MELSCLAGSRFRVDGGESSEVFTCYSFVYDRFLVIHRSSLRPRDVVSVKNIYCRMYFTIKPSFCLSRIMSAVRTLDLYT